MQRRSRCVKRMRSPIQKPLLRMLWCVSIAPLGKPVVPEVYWMLMTSSKSSEACRSTSASGETRVARFNSASQLSKPSFAFRGAGAPSRVLADASSANRPEGSVLVSSVLLPRVWRAARQTAPEAGALPRETSRRKCGTVSERRPLRGSAHASSGIN